MDAALRQQSEYFTARLAARKADIVRRGLRVFDFGTGDPPFVTPEFIKDALRRALPEISCYPSARGSAELRKTVADWLSRRYGACLDPEKEILPIQGGKEAIFHLPLIAFIPGEDLGGKDTVIFGEPAYPVYRWGTLFAGARPLAQTLSAGDDYLLRLDRFAPADLARTRLVFLNSPHNPTGAVASKSYLEDLYALCRRHDILLCSDECYSELYVDAPPTGMLEIATAGVLAVNSLSKRSGLTGYRSGFAAGDERWIAELVHFRNPMGVAPTDFVQAAAVAAWRDEDHVTQRRAAFRERRALMTAGLRDLGLSVPGGQAGIFVWAILPDGRDAEPYAARLAEGGIIACPGAWLGPGARDALRVALAPALEDCAQALDVWRSLGGP